MFEWTCVVSAIAKDLEIKKKKKKVETVHAPQPFPNAEQELDHIECLLFEKLSCQFFQSLHLLSELFCHDCKVASCRGVCESRLLLGGGPCCVWNL